MRRQRFPAWLAALAIALQAFWPLLATAAPRSAHLVPVCTTGGETHYVEIPGSRTPVEQRAASHGDHCSFCFFGADKAIAAPAAVELAASEPSSLPPGNGSVLLVNRVVLTGKSRAPPSAP